MAIFIKLTEGDNKYVEFKHPVPLKLPLKFLQGDHWRCEATCKGKGGIRGTRQVDGKLICECFDKSEIEALGVPPNPFMELLLRMYEDNLDKAQVSLEMDEDALRQLLLETEVQFVAWSNTVKTLLIESEAKTETLITAKVAITQDFAPGEFSQELANVNVNEES